MWMYTVFAVVRWRSEESQMRKHLSKASKTKEENLIVQAEPATPNSPLKEINRRVRKNKNKRNGKSHTGKTIHRVVIKLCLSRQAAPWRVPAPSSPPRCPTHVRATCLHHSQPYATKTKP